MPTPTNIQAELERHRASNGERLKQLVDEQYNTEITRAFLLRFSAADRGDAQGLGRLLFAKGLRLMTIEPERQPDGSFEVRAVVKHNLREITQEPFICDLITLASGVHAAYEGWEFLAEGSAEETQPPNGTPDIQP